MARHNLTFLYGAVAKDPEIKRNNIGEILYVMAYVRVVRADRPVGDKRTYMKSDAPIILTRDPEIIKEMAEWKKNDLVEIKGMIAVREMKKASRCKECKTRNAVAGTLTYVNPIFAKKRGEFPTENEAVAYLAKNREISNQVFLFGELCTNPEKFNVKAGLVVTQYQIALNRKYHVKKDPPEIRTDYIWVKSYGENAIRDAEHLHVGSAIFVDGCLQARSVTREFPSCEGCHKPYKWKDKVMEVVPYECEYMREFYSQEEVNAIKERKLQELKENLMRSDAESFTS